MIYLIDDKKQRQLGYGWNDLKIEKFKQYIITVYNYDQILEENLRERIFSPGSIVLFHESFFDTATNKHEKDSIAIRTELEKYAKRTQDFSLAFFSGSKNSRSFDNNVINLPVGALYSNLEIFIKKYSEGIIDLRFLLFGENPEIEEILTQLFQAANQNLDNLLEYSSNSTNLYLRTHNNFIQKPLIEFDQETLIKVSDADLNKYISDWLNKKEYNNIFIPLCFGSVLSDYNGLRLSLHIRTTITLNQFTNIFIYGFVDHSFLVNNEYFDVLKTKNVKLIDYRRTSFRDAIFLEHSPMIKSELSCELEKICLNPPKNYEDSHSISNEWSIIRWFNTLEASGIIDYTPDEIESIGSKINSNLYYKLLTCRFPLDNSITLKKKDLKLNNNGKVLYIDDEKEKGWNELFCALLLDEVINKVENFDSIGSDFYCMKKSEIIKTCIEKAKDFDLIILDFRLIPEDFHEVNPKNITGYQILRGIKEYNKGIQVIIFSATNKVWNWQILQDAGVDGFIIKESPENSIDHEFTIQSILSLIKVIDYSLKFKFLKNLYSSFNKLTPNLLARKDFKKRSDFLPKEFVDEIIKWKQISLDNLVNNKTEAGITTSYLLSFSIIENISNRLIDIDNPIEIKRKNLPSKFEFEFRTTSDKLSLFIDDKRNPGHYRKLGEVLQTNRSITWTQKILNSLDHISNKKFNQESINRLIEKRNNLIHANATTGNLINIEIEDLVDLNDLIILGLTNIK